MDATQEKLTGFRQIEAKATTLRDEAATPSIKLYWERIVQWAHECIEFGIYPEEELRHLREWLGVVEARGRLEQVADAKLKIELCKSIIPLRGSSVAQRVTRWLRAVVGL